MRKIYAVVAAVLAMACLASSASAAADPIKVLNRKVATLEKQVKTLRTSLTEAEETKVSLGPLVPVAQYGGVFNGVPEGYVYGVGQGGAAQLFLTTGLDLINPSGLTPGEDYAPVMTWAGRCAGNPPDTFRIHLRPLPSDAAAREIARFAW